MGPLAGDYPYPLGWFDVLLNGNHIVDQDNNNYAYRQQESTSDREPEEGSGSHRPVNQRWAAVEKSIMQDARGRRGRTVFPSFTKMGCVHIQLLYGIDWTRLCRSSEVGTDTK